MKNFLPETGKIRGLFLLGFFLLLNVHLGFAQSAATVTTDKDDYSPGEYVIITGSGWEAGETVEFTFEETPKPESCVNSHDHSVEADLNGNIYYDQFLIKENHIGVSFVLTATGTTSGFEAQTTFTDGNIRIETSGTGSISVKAYQYNSSNCSGSSGPEINSTADDSGSPDVVAFANSGSSAFIIVPATNGGAVFSSWTTNDTFTTPNLAKPYEICVVGKQGTIDLKANYISCITISNNTIGSAQTICPNSTPAGLTGSTPTGGSGSYTYLWESSITNASSGFAPASGTNNTKDYGPGTLTQDTWYRRKVNSGSCAQSESNVVKITVSDDEDPTVTASGDTTASTSDDGAGDCTVDVAITDATFDDNCSSNLTWEMTGATIASGSGQVGTQTFNLGVTTITYTNTDGSSNTAMSSMTVTVSDDEDPTIACVSDPQNRDTDTGSCDYTVIGGEFDPTSFADNCPGSTISNNINGTATLAGEVFSEGTTSVTWTVTDATGNNTASCSFDVIVTDNEDPTIACVSDPQNRDTDTGSCDYTVIGGEFDPTSFADNCPGSTISNNINGTATLAGEVFSEGTTSVTWTVTDATGNNTASCSFDVIVTDNEDPTIACVSDPQNRDTDTGSCDYTVIGGEFDPTSFADNCPGSTISNNINGTATLAGEVFSEGTTSVTWTVTDATGNNTASCSFDVIVTDNEDPTIACVSDPQNRDTDTGSCDYTVIGGEFDPTSFADNCPGSTISNNINGTATLAGEVFSEGTTSVTWTVTDATGNNTASCSFDVIVTDNEDPTIACVSDPQNRDTDTGSCDYTVIGGEFDPTSFADNCPGSTISNNINGTATLAGEVFSEGTTSVTWTVTDATGNNTASCSFDVIVTDNEDPTIACVSDPQNRDTDTGSCDYTVIGGEFDPTSFADNCPGSTISNNINGTATLAGEVFSEGTTSVTWTVTDATGNNTASCSFDVIVTDNEDPTIACVSDPQNRDTDTGSCDYTVIGGEFDPTSFADNCPGSTISNNINGTATLAGEVFSEGTTSVTWTVTDATGNNTASCSFDVIVTDNEDPTIACVSDPQNRDTDTGSCDYTVIGGEFDPTSFADNCPGSTISNNINGTATLAGEVFSEGTTSVTWTVTDATGNNTASCSFDVIVTDNEDPTIACVSDPQNRDTDTGSCDYTVIGGEFDPTSFADNCPGSTISNNINGTATLAGEVFSEGTTSVTWTVTDATGNNTASCSFDVIVTDNEDPTIACVSDPQNRDTDTGSCDYTVIGGEFDPTSFADNCPGSTISNNINGTATLAGEVFSEGTTSVTWTVTDATGNNTASCSFDVIVTDNEDPTIACVSDPQNRDTDTGSCDYTVIGGEFDPTSFADNCPGSTISNNINGTATLAGEVFSEGTTSVTWTVTDATGNNTASCSFDVIVTDNEDPTIACVSDPQNRDTDTGSCDYTVIGGEFDPTSFADNCPGSTISNNINGTATLAGEVFSEGTTSVTWTVTDATGNNTASCSFDVIVTDNEDPTIACVSDPQNRDTDTGSCDYTVIGGEFDPTSFADNCPGSTISNNINGTATLAGEVFSEGTTSVTWTVTDATGNNTASCSFDVIVTDNEDPTIACVSDPQNRDTDTGSCDYTVIGGEFDPTSFADNCPGSTISNNINGTATLAGEVFSEGTTSVTWTVTDATGNNTASCSFDVIVTDNEDPTIACVSDPQNRDTDTGSCDYTVIGGEFDPTSFADNCPGSTISNNINGTATLAGEVFSEGTTSVTWTVTDATGNNTASCSFDVIVTDNEDPTIACVSDPQNRDTDTGSCDYTVIGGEFDPTSFADNCPGSTISNNINGTATLAGEVFSEGTTSVTWTVTDATGNNTANCSFDVIVTDNEDPTIACVSDPQNRDTDTGSCDYTVIGGEFDPTSFADNCPGSTISNNINGTATLAGEVFSEGTTSVTWTVTDATGNNTASCSFDVIVTDNEDPTIACVSDPQNRDTDTGSCDYTVIGGEFDPTSFADNCPGSTISNNINGTATLAGEVFSEGTTSVTWTVTDATGNNTASCSFDVIVTDNEDPTIACVSDPQNRDTDTGSCDYTVIGGEFDPTSFADNCPGSTISNNINGTATLAGEVFSEGTTSVTWTVTDATGNNTASCSFDVIVTDNEDPTIACVSDPQNRDTDTGSCDYTVIGGEFDPTSFADNCPGSTISNNINGTATLAGEVFSEGTTSVTWTVTDATGNNTASCSFDVIVTDNEDPTIACVSDPQNRDTDTGSCDYTVIGGEFDPTSFADNCPGSTISNNINGTATLAGEVFSEGTTSVTWTVTDATGNNTASCSFDVIVTDNEDPTIACVSDPQNRDTDTGSCDYTVIGGEFDPTSFADNCPGSTISNNINGTATLAGEVFSEGTTSVTWTVTDATGNNTASCSFDVIVTDNEDPTIACVSDPQNRDTDTGSCDYTIIGGEFDPTSFADNCPGSTISNNINGTATLAGEVFSEGTTSVTWTVTDATGNNTASCSFDVIVTDNEDPTIACVSDPQNRDTDTGSCDYTVIGGEFDPTSFADNCPGSTISNNINGTATLAGEVFSEGTTSVTWTVTDATGNNTASCSFDVIVNNIVPIIISITGPTAPVELGANVNLTAEFNDDNNIKRITWRLIADDMIQYENTCEPTETPCDSSWINGSNLFTSFTPSPGVYSVELELEDYCGEIVTLEDEEYVVVFDPSGGFVTGGGWIWSPKETNLPQYMSNEGKANFGFNAKYKNGKNNTSEVDGNTNFQFKEGDFHFKSSSHDDMSLVISGRKATFTGKGTVNGSGSYEFRLIAIDGDFQNGTDPDKFRIKIWHEGQPNNVVYDNRFEVSESSDSATELGGGSIVIHKPRGNKKTTESSEKTDTQSTEPAPENLNSLEVAPNPMVTYTDIRFSLKANLKADLFIFDMRGRQLRTLHSAVVDENDVIQVRFDRGSLPSGVYICKLVTGDGRSYERQIVID